MILTIRKTLVCMKIGVVGVGVWGENHVKCLSLIPEVTKLVVFDTCRQKLEKVHEQYAAVPCSVLDDLLSCDAVVVAAPTVYHYNLGSYFITHKIPCLIEKPLAFSSQEARNLTILAKEYKSLLMVGHIEHFNPAFLKLKQGLASDEKIIAIDIQRLGMARPGLDKSVDVIFDLMIHDIELTNNLTMDDKIVDIRSYRTAHQDALGHVHATLHYQSGTIVNMTSSRVCEKKQRTINLITTKRHLSVDLLAQRLIETRSINNKQVIRDIEVAHHEPLRAELSHFLACIADPTACIVTSDAGLEAVEIAERIKSQVMGANIEDACVLT